MAISTSNQNSSSTQYPACAEPGYVTTLTVGGRVYQIFACIEEPNGTKNYLPSNCNPQTFEKIQSLTSGLINAHDARRQSLNEAPYDLKMLDVRGLMKADNTLVSHDFLIQPVSLLIADQMASAISLAGQPMQAPAVKAIDIWTTMEELIQNEIGGTSRPAQLPIQNIPTPSSPLPTSTNSTPPETDQPLDPHTPPPPASTNSTRAETNQHTPASPPPPLSNESAPLSTPRKWITASEPDLQGLDLDGDDGYSQIPGIITEIVENRCLSRGGDYEKVWKFCETRVKSKLGYDSTSVVEALLVVKELKDLKDQMLCCRDNRLAIHPDIRQEASELIAAFYNHLDVQKKIILFMQKEFAFKEQLLYRIGEQAAAEGVVIEKECREWAELHYLENSRRFVLALTSWLDPIKI
jgi:hypothetical protein